MGRRKRKKNKEKEVFFFFLELEERSVKIIRKLVFFLLLVLVFFHYNFVSQSFIEVIHLEYQGRERQYFQLLFLDIQEDNMT